MTFELLPRAVTPRLLVLVLAVEQRFVRELPVRPVAAKRHIRDHALVAVFIDNVQKNITDFSAPDRPLAIAFLVEYSKLGTSLGDNRNLGFGAVCNLQLLPERRALLCAVRSDSERCSAPRSTTQRIRLKRCFAVTKLQRDDAFAVDFDFAEH